MAFTSVMIANWALQLIGDAGSISSLEEDTPEAIRCKVFLPLALETFLEETNWSFARRTVSLALVSIPNVDHPQWVYRFQYPSDCVRLREIISTANCTPFLFETGIVLDRQKQEVRVVFTNTNPAVAVYTRRIATLEMLPGKAAHALALNLASMICDQVTGDHVRRDKLLNMARIVSHEASVHDANQRNAGQEMFIDANHVPPSISGRWS